MGFSRQEYCSELPLPSLILLKRSLVFPILLLSSISLHWLLSKAFLSLLAILCNPAFKWVYLSFSPLPFASLLFTAICKASSDSHFAFLHFYFLGWSWSLSPVQCHEPLSIVLQALSVRSSPLNLFLTSTVWIRRDYYLLLCAYYCSIKDYALFFFVFIALWHFGKGITCEIINSVPTEINVIFRKIEHLFWNFLKWPILSLITPSIFLLRNALSL